MRMFLAALIMALTMSPLNAFTCKLEETLIGKDGHVAKTVLVQMNGLWGAKNHVVNSISFPSIVTPYCYYFGEWRCAADTVSAYGVPGFSSAVMYLIGKDDFIILLKQAWIDTRETPKGKANFVNNVIEHKGRYSCKY